jgi:molybdenum cofactor synthesis domain-containing protein
MKCIKISLAINITHQNYNSFIYDNLKRLNKVTVMSVRGHGFANVLRVDQIQDIILDQCKFTPTTATISSIDALDRILAENVVSKVNLPGFKRSAMDGYAVIASNTYGASETSPITLTVCGVVEIGDIKAPIIEDNTTVRISTGAPLPDGANAVVRLEDCEIISEDQIDVIVTVNAGSNVAKKDEDVKKGQTVLSQGTLLKPWDIALLESIAQHEIKIYSKPRISVLSTGNELIPAGKTPQIGEVIDSNRPAITAWLDKFQVDIVKSETCPDEYERLKDKLLELVETSDLIITTGGTSVGTKDYLPEIIREIGELWVHGCAIRPGKPIAIGTIKEKAPIIALPGYPLAAFINFELFVETILTQWTKMKTPWKDQVKVKLNSKIPSRSGVRDFVRLRQVEDGAEVIRITGAGILSSLVTADYMLEIPEDVEGYPEGTEVIVRKMR